MVAKDQQPELEQRRLRAAQMLRDGLPAIEIARHLGVSAASVRAWSRRFLAEGETGLLAREAGRRKRLAPAEREKLKRLLKQRPASHPKWTAQLIAELIRTNFNVEYTANGAREVICALGIDVLKRKRPKPRQKPPASEPAHMTPVHKTPTERQLTMAARLQLDIARLNRSEAASLIERTLRFRSRARIAQLELEAGDRVLWSALVETPGGAEHQSGEGVVAFIHPSFRVVFADGKTCWALDITEIVDRPVR